MFEYDPASTWGPLSPVETAVSLLANTGKALCGEDVRRVYLRICASSTQGVNVSTKASVGASTGRVVNNSGAGDLILTYADAGPLVGQAWFGFTAIATTVTVFELLLVYDPAQRSSTNQRREDAESESHPPYDLQRGGERDSAAEPTARRARFLSPIGERLRNQLHGSEFSWRRDSDSGGFYPVRDG